jgi:1-acyl-sn-glycerol-3-phosphate acyltransferase
MARRWDGGAVLYRVVRILSRIAVNAYFARIEVGHPGRVPEEGPVLLVANHPSSLTDVLVLGVAIPRRLHFLAHSGLFRPWIRGVFLRLAGTLPVYRREDDPTQTHRNEETFRACYAFFDEGGVVVIFPEGTSQTDRQVQRLKTGAARLALGYDALPGRAGRLAVVPVGLHFDERTAFRSDVVLSVGRPIDLAPFRARYAGDPEGTVRALTDAMQSVIEKLILYVPRVEMAGLVDDIEHLYLEELKGAMPDAPDLALAQGIADCVTYFSQTDPTRLYRVWRRVAAYKRRLTILNLRDQTVRERILPDMIARTSARLLTLGVVGFVPALAGALVHIVPYKLADLIAGVASPDPTRISFGRIVSGVILFPLTYAALAWVAWRAGWSAKAVAATLAACIPLGVVALAYFRWLKRERHRLRLAFLATTNRRLVARIRSERRRLIRSLDEARREYLAATGGKEARGAHAAPNAAARDVAREPHIPETARTNASESGNVRSASGAVSYGEDR